MSTLSIKRVDLIAHLERQLEVAKQYDKEAEAKHRKEEQEFLKKFREACREAAKWDYETAKNKGWMVMPYPHSRAPSCPVSMAAQMQVAIDRLKLDQRVSLKLSQDGQDQMLYQLAVWSPNPPKQDVC